MISCIVLYSRDLDRSIQNVSKTEEGAPEFSANFLKAKNHKNDAQLRVFNMLLTITFSLNKAI